MKFLSVLFLLVSSSAAIELNIDTLLVQNKTLFFNNTSSTTVLFDSARFELIKGEINQCQLKLSCFIPNKPENFFFFSTYYALPEQNMFSLEVRPYDTVFINIETLDYCAACIPEYVIYLSEPLPIQAKLVFFTNIGIDSIYINGFQRSAPISLVTNKKYPNFPKRTEHNFSSFAIDGRKEHRNNVFEDKTRSNGMYIYTKRSSNGIFTSKKSITLQKKP